MDFVRCPCGNLIGMYKELFDYIYTNKIQLYCKENKISPDKIDFHLSNINVEEIFEYLNLDKPCCRVHIKNYYDPIKNMLS